MKFIKKMPYRLTAQIIEKQPVYR